MLVALAGGGVVVVRRGVAARDALLVEGEGGEVCLLDVVDEQVRSLNQAGEVLWKYDPPDHVSYLSASASGDVVAVVSGRTLALVEPGRRRWARGDWTEYLEL